MINLINDFQPNKKILFELHEMRRVNVNVSQEAQAIIDQSTKEGRLFPLALSETFGKHEQIAEIDVDTIAKKDIHPWAEDPETKLIKITIKHTDSKIEDGVRYMNASDLNVIHPSGVWGFNAANTAYEHFRLHMQEKGL